MLKEDAIKFFGGVTSVATAAGVKPPTVSEWGDVVPEGRAHRLADASGGALVPWTKEQYDNHRQVNRDRKKHTAQAHKESD